MPKNSSGKAYTYIASNDQLAQTCSAIPSNSLLAIDCEFIRRTTFLPIPALLQLGWLHDNRLQLALVDPLTIDDWTPFVQRIQQASRACPVVMHAASEDVQVLRQLGIGDFCLFDTQLAMAITEGKDALGYGNLVETMLHQQVPRASKVQQSNWLKRPLSRAQLDYALLDVIHLPALFFELATRLAVAERTDWHWQECSLLFRYQEKWSEGQAWRNIKGGDRVRDSIGRARLQMLADWRELLAVTLNRPRSMLVADDMLLQISKDPKALMQVLDTSRYANEISAEQIETLGQQLLQVKGEDAPPLKHLTRSQAAEFKRLKELVARRAKKLQLVPRLLADKRKIGDWVAGNTVNFGVWQTPLMMEILHTHKQSEAGRKGGV